MGHSQWRDLGFQKSGEAQVGHLGIGICSRPCPGISMHRPPSPMLCNRFQCINVFALITHNLNKVLFYCFLNVICICIYYSNSKMSDVCRHARVGGAGTFNRYEIPDFFKMGRLILKKCRKQGGNFIFHNF